MLKESSVESLVSLFSPLQVCTVSTLDNSFVLLLLLLLMYVNVFLGARKSGTEGFLKGVGKGALSVLTKPTLGVVDLAYFTLEGIRR